MTKRFFVAWLAVFVAWMAGSIVIHGVLLNADYAKLANLFRSHEDAGKYFGFMIAGHVLMAGALVWIYRQGVADKPFLGQGLRFGCAVALLTVVPMYLIYYAVQPMPGGLVARQIVFDSALVVVLGVLVAWMSREGKGSGV